MKSNGQCTCGFFLSGTFSWDDAKKECADQGARLPEIYSKADNDKIFKIRVMTLELSCPYDKNYINASEEWESGIVRFW